jgi:predicted nucleic acid-binding protein
VVDTNVLLSGLMYPNSTPVRIVAAWRNVAFELVLARAQLTNLAVTLHDHPPSEPRQMSTNSSNTTA